MTLPFPAAGQFEGQAHLLPVRVYYEDTDFTGLVYHGAYVRWCERGRTEFLRSAGVSHAGLLDLAEPMAFAVTRMDIEFHRAARIDDALIVRTAFEAFRGPRLYIAQTVERDGQPLAVAHIEVACISLDGHARRPPAALLEQLKPWLGPPGP
jgi:acyl-CoA thioester hydrolase